MFFKTINAVLSFICKVAMSGDRGMDSVYAVADATAYTAENYRDEVVVKAHIKSRELEETYGIDYQAIKSQVRQDQSARIAALESK